MSAALAARWWRWRSTITCPGMSTIPFAVVGAAIFGAAWAFIPAWLQAKRGSHIVITTIMFNFIGAALMVYLLVQRADRSAARWRRKPALFSRAAGFRSSDWLMAMFGLEAGAGALQRLFSHRAGRVLFWSGC